MPSVAAVLTASLCVILIADHRYAAGQTPQPPLPPGRSAGVISPSAAQRGGVLRAPVNPSRPAEIRFETRYTGKPKVEPADLPKGFRYKSAFPVEAFHIEAVVDGFLPEYFRGATVVGAASVVEWDEKNGRCELTVEADRRIYAVFDWDTNTVHSEELKREIMT
jgi:hypothetical protein